MKITALIRCDFRDNFASKTLLKLKLTVALLITAFLQVNAVGFSQVITLSQKNAQLEDVFKEIMNQTNFEFVYLSEALQDAAPVDVELTNATLKEALEQCFEGQLLAYTVLNNTVIVRTKLPPVKGKVTNTQGETLPGATVIIENTSIGTLTDSNGEFSLEIPEGLKGSVTLIVSYVGYETSKKTVSIEGLKEIIVNFELAEASVSLGRVTITANKRTGTVIEAPLAVQAIAAAKLNETGVRDLSELITFVPGGSEVGSNSIGERMYQLRGVAPIAGDATVGYYLDEAAFNYYGSNYAPISKSFDMNRVEILRGPQSTLYGGGAMGGAIKYVPNKPNLQKVEGEVSLGGNSLKGGDPGYSGDAAISVPIVKDKLALRLTGSYENVGGYAEGPDGEKNVDGGYTKLLRGSLLFSPISSLKINLTYQGTGFKQTGGTSLITTDPPVISGNPTDFTKNWTDWYIGNLTFDFSDFATLSSTTSYLVSDQPSKVSFNIIGLGQMIGDIYGNVNALNHETRLASNTNSPVQWLAGVYYINTEFVTGAKWNIPGFDNENVLTSKAFSVFGEISYSFLEGKLTPLFGIRSYNDTRSFDFNTNGGLQKEEFTSINPRFNLSYKPNKYQNYYLNIAKGFRSGVFNNPVWLQVHIDQGLPGKVAVPSDELWSYEIGSKHEFAENQILLELAAFYQLWKGMQSNLPDQLAGYFMKYQVGDVVVPGLDLVITYTPKKVTGLFFQLVANVNDAKYKKIDPALIALTGAENGDRINLVPAWNMGVNANYRWDLGSSEKWKGNAMIAYTHTAPQRGFPVSKIGDAQDLLRARLGIDYNNYSLAVYGNNILNETGAIFIQNTSALTYYNQTRPALFGIEFRAKF